MPYRWRGRPTPYGGEPGNVIANAFFDLGRELATSGQDAFRRQTIEDETAKGALAGLKAAQTGAPLELGGQVSLAGQTYNAAAKKSYLLHAANQIRDELGTAAVEHEADPDGFARAVDGVRAKFASAKLPADVGAMIENDLSDISGRFRAAISKTAAKRARDETYVAGVRMLDNLRAEAETAADAGNVDGILRAERTHSRLVDEMLREGLITGPQAVALERRRSGRVVGATARRGVDEAYDAGGDPDADRYIAGVDAELAAADADDGRAAAAARFFVSRGWSPVAAAGIVGNLLHESGLRTDAAGDGGTSHGVAQWRGPRLAALQAFARKTGGNWRDLETQLTFVDQELRGDEASAGRALAGARTVEEANAAMLAYERPSGFTPGAPQRSHGYENRLGNARAVWLAAGGGDATPSERARVVDMLRRRARQRGIDDRKAEAAADRDYRRRSADVYKDALDAQARGELTVEWVQERRDRMTATDYDRTMRMATRPERATTDPHVYTSLSGQADDGLDVTEAADQSYIEGHITRADRDRLVFRAEKERDSRRKEGARFVRDSFKPSMGASLFGDDTEAKQRMLDAEREFADWYDGVAAGGRPPSREDVRRKADEIVAARRGSAGPGVSAQMITNMEAALAAQLKAGTISRQDAEARAVEIQRLRARLGGDPVSAENKAKAAP